MTSPAFVCPVCNATSHHPEDVAHGYCAHCHAFTGCCVMGGCREPVTTTRGSAGLCQTHAQD